MCVCMYVCMYVCMFVAHLTKVEQPLATKKHSGGRGDGGPSAARGSPPGRKKARGEGREEKGSQVVPSLPVSTAKARAAPSPGRVSAGVAPATASRGFPLKAVPGATPDPQVQADPGYSTQQTAQSRGLGWHALDVRGRALSALSASSAKPPERSKTKSRQTPLSGSSSSTALLPGEWQGPSRVRSHWPQKAAERQGQ